MKCEAATDRAYQGGLPRLCSVDLAAHGAVSPTKGSEMLRATVTMTVREGRQGAFEPAWRAVATEVRRAPGHLRQALARDPGDPRVFVVMSDWETAEAFREFERSPQQDVLTAPLRELRESASMTVHELVAHLEGDASCPHE